MESPLGCRTSRAGFAVVPVHRSPSLQSAQRPRAASFITATSTGLQEGQSGTCKSGEETRFLQVEAFVETGCSFISGLFLSLMFYGCADRECHEWQPLRFIFLVGPERLDHINATTDPLWHILVLVGQCSPCCCLHGNGFCGVKRAALTLFLSSWRVSLGTAAEPSLRPLQAAVETFSVKHVYW